MAPQSYYLGGKIRAIDYNGFADDINDIVGIGADDSGYGQPQLVIPNVASGVKINANHMQLLLTALKFAGRHQGTTILSPLDTSSPLYPTPGNLIELVPNLTTDITNVRSNKLNYDIAMMDIQTNVISSSKTYLIPGNTTPEYVWDNIVTYEVSAIFLDEDTRRHYFNTGGEIRLDTSFTASGTDLQSLDWQTLFSDVGMVKLGHNVTTVTGNTGVPDPLGNGITGGFKSLTNTYKRIYHKQGGTSGGNSNQYYGSNRYEIYARLNGTNAIDFQLKLIDNHVADQGEWGGYAWYGQDYVAGTLTAQVDLFFANDPDPSGLGVKHIPSGSKGPTFVAISEL